MATSVSVLAECESRMGTFAASVHLDRTSCTEPALAKALRALDAKDLTATWDERWLSLHHDEGAFAIGAFEVGQTLSRTAKARVLVLALLDGDEARCTLFERGRNSAELTATPDSPPRWNRSAWQNAGASKKALDAVADAEVEDMVFELARAFGVPGDTVLADEGEDAVEARPASSSKPKLAQALPADLEAVRDDWNAFVAEARGVPGMMVQDFDGHVQSAARLGQPLRARDLRAQLSLLRQALASQSQPKPPRR
jgi:hypothetical protein